MTIAADEHNPTKLQRAIGKLEADLAWRGPNGKVMGHILLTRELAEAALAVLSEHEAHAVKQEAPP